MPGAASTDSWRRSSARHAHRVLSLQHEGQRRAGGDEAHELAEERLLRVLGVVPLGKLSIDVEQLRRANHEAASLEAPDDLAEQAALHGVGLDEDERPLHAGNLLGCSTLPPRLRSLRGFSSSVRNSTGLNRLRRETGVSQNGQTCHSGSRGALQPEHDSRSRVVQTGQTR